MVSYNAGYTLASVKTSMRLSFSVWCDSVEFFLVNFLSSCEKKITPKTCTSIHGAVRNIERLKPYLSKRKLTGTGAISHPEDRPTNTTAIAISSLSFSK